ncbi:MAG: hypothetical protein ACOCZU_07905 [Planctomycetota bacterium]
MKSERRHELQQNELDQELHEMVRWFRRNASRVIWIVILVIGLVIAGWYWVYNARQANAAIQGQFTQAVVFPSPELTQAEQIRNLQELSEADNRSIAAAAILRMGNIYLLQTTTLPQPMEAVQAGERAVLQFNRVIKDFAQLPDMVAGAYYGLAKEAEGREDWTQAREYYEKVANMPQLSGNPVLLLAQGGLNDLAGLKEPVYLSDVTPVNALPMGPINATREFFRAVDAGQDETLAAMFTKNGAAGEAAELIRNLPDGEAPGILSSDVAETSAFVLTRPVRGEDDSLKPLVIHLMKKGEEWKISSVQLKTVDQAKADQAAFRKEFPKARIDIEPMTDLSLDPTLPESQPEPDANDVDANAVSPISPIAPVETDANNAD